MEAWEVEPAFRKRQIAAWLFERRASSFEEMTDLPAGLRKELAEGWSLRPLEMARLQGSKDTTRKFLWRLASKGDFIESVLIPATPGIDGAQAGRRTLCVSTQVGCAYGCKFCASGLEGFKRNLSPAEIAAQVIETERATGERVDNLVFMGMGEPLANYQNLMVAIEILNAPWGCGIGARHITISTSGLAPMIRRLAEEPRQTRLALSLHGATNEVRERIMPVNKKYPLEVLLDACAHYQDLKGKMVTLEYILIEDVNDAPDQARLLAQHAKRLFAKVNLIPYNHVEGLAWKRPSESRIKMFADLLRMGGARATVRREKGHDIDAACGQLRLRELRAGPDAREGAEAA